jgi:hypothetical protein
MAESGWVWVCANNFLGVGCCAQTGGLPEPSEHDVPGVMFTNVGDQFVISAAIGVAQYYYFRWLVVDCGVLTFLN